MVNILLQPYVKNLIRDAYSKGNLLEVGEGTANEAALLTQGTLKYI